MADSDLLTGIPECRNSLDSYLRENLVNLACRTSQVLRIAQHSQPWVLRPVLRGEPAATRSHNRD